MEYVASKNDPAGNCENAGMNGGFYDNLGMNAMDYENYGFWDNLGMDAMDYEGFHDNLGMNTNDFNVKKSTKNNRAN